MKNNKKILSVAFILALLAVPAAQAYVAAGWIVAGVVAALGITAVAVHNHNCNCCGRSHKTKHEADNCCGCGSTKHKQHHHDMEEQEETQNYEMK
ncbi:MAG: hypothetical protein UU47_C0001G0097 [candidate division TM6 bacterium GW2011_GWE2_41_16]|nr:MAG: hypothetical protein UU47_C0001G0097 [candidate division TM6 bacterium GW2011_GWE2_41_16]